MSKNQYTERQEVVLPITNSSHTKVDLIAVFRAPAKTQNDKATEELSSFILRRWTFRPRRYGGSIALVENTQIPLEIANEFADTIQDLVKTHQQRISSSSADAGQSGQTSGDIQSTRAA